MTPEKPSVKEFPVGSVCILLVDKNCPGMAGKELTITGPLKIQENPEFPLWWGYDTDMVHNGFRVAPQHHNLKLKRLPPEVDAWCREVMRKVTGNAPLSSKGDILVVKETQ